MGFCTDFCGHRLPHLQLDSVRWPCDERREKDLEGTVCGEILNSAGGTEHGGSLLPLTLKPPDPSEKRLQSTAEPSGANSQEAVAGEVCEGG